MPSTEEHEMLREQFENTARWRREKAREYPDDERNLWAAETLERLAATVADVDPQLLTAYFELFDDLPDSEAEQEMFRSVGFHSAPETAEEFIRGFIADRTGG